MFGEAGGVGGLLVASAASGATACEGISFLALVAGLVEEVGAGSFFSGSGCTGTHPPGEGEAACAAKDETPS